MAGMTAQSMTVISPQRRDATKIGQTRQSKIDRTKFRFIEHDLGLLRDTDCQNMNGAQTLVSYGL